MNSPTKPGIASAALFAVAIGVAEAAGRFGGVGDFELPAGMRTQTIGDWQRVNAVETRTWQFRSTEDADGIAAHFAREWDGRIARSAAGGWDFLSHRQDDWLITVQTGPEDASGRSRGFIAIAKRFGSRAAADHQPTVPRLPRTQLLHDIEAEDLGRRSRTLLLVSDQSAAQNLDFYRAHFRAEGFVPTTAGALLKGADGGVLSLNRGTEKLDLAIARRDGRSWITIVQVRP